MAPVRSLCRRGPATGLLLWPALVGLALLAGCREKPSDAAEALGEHAERRDLVHFRALFTDSAKALLRRTWREDGLTEPQGWLDLMIGYLGRDKAPPEVLGEQLTDENTAIVKVAKDDPKQGKRVVQDLRFVKEGGRWRLDLGEMVYAEQDLQTGEEHKPKALPKLADEDWGLGGGDDGKPQRREDLQDFDLEKLDKK